VFRHIRIQMRGDLVGAVQYRYMDLSFQQILQHFQPDEARPYDDGILRLFLFHIFHDGSRVLCRTQGKHARVIGSGQIRQHGLRTGCHNQLVVIVFKRIALIGLAEDFFSRRVDFCHFMAAVYLHTVFFGKRSRRTRYHIRKAHLAPDMIRKTAGGIRNIPVLFINDDICLFIVSHNLRRSRSPRRHRANNNHFHRIPPVLLYTYPNKKRSVHSTRFCSLIFGSYSEVGIAHILIIQQF
jgi:hypothetical protein